MTNRNWSHHLIHMTPTAGLDWLPKVDAAQTSGFQVLSLWNEMHDACLTKRPLISTKIPRYKQPEVRTIVNETMRIR